MISTKDFNAFLIMSALSQMGNALLSFCVTTVAVKNLSATPFEVGIVNAAIMLPYFILSLFAGVIIDRTRSSIVFKFGNISRGILFALISILIYFEALTLSGLTVIVFIVSAVAMLLDVADQALVPRIVRPEDLRASNSKLEMVRSLTFVIGPASVGLVISYSSISGAIYLGSIFYILSAGFACALKDNNWRRFITNDHAIVEIKNGLIFVLNTSMIRSLTTCAVIWNFASAAFVTVLASYTISELGFSPAQYGVLIASQGAGMLVAAFVARPLGRLLTTKQGLIVGPAISLAGLLLAALPTTTAWALAMLAVSLFMFGAGPTMWTVNQLSVRQKITPASLQGRVGATVRFFTFGVRPLGALMGGAIGAVVEGRTAIIFLFGIFVLSLVPIFRAHFENIEL